eukprot:UN26509
MNFVKRTKPIIGNVLADDINMNEDVKDRRRSKGPLPATIFECESIEFEILKKVHPDDVLNVCLAFESCRKIVEG